MIRWQADLLRRFLTPERQVTIGVVMVDLGILMALLWPVIARSEPPVIYELSVLALIFTGVEYAGRAVNDEDG